MTFVLDRLGHDVAPELRPWIDAAPALAIWTYFVLAFLVFVALAAMGRMPRMDEAAARASSQPVRAFWVHWYYWALHPLWAMVLYSGVPANALTTLAVFLGLGAGVAVAAGWFLLGAALLLLSGILDSMDGRLARARGEVHAVGGALDSILDRYTDAALLIGLSWYYRGSWVLLAAVASLVGTMLVPYVRAKGEALGISVRDGAMQRTGRFVCILFTLGTSTFFNLLVFPPAQHAMHWVAAGGLVLLAVATNATAVGRLVQLVRALGGQIVPEKPGEWLGLLGSNAIASTVATLVDFGVVVALVETAQVHPVLATAMGSAVGALLHFTLGRVWAFKSRAAPLPQLGRYLFVSGVTLVLNSGGIALLSLHPTLGYALGWWLVRGAVHLTWSFPLYRAYVFGPAAEAQIAQEERSSLPAPEDA